MAHNNADPFIVTSDAVARGMEERRQRQQRETMAQNVGFISYLHGLDHLYRMEELIVSGEATVDFLTLEDYRTLERMHPKGIPPTIREKLFGAHELITMRILAAKGPEGIVEMTGNLFDAPKDAVLMRKC